MTFIGIKCHADHAEVVTDSAVYTAPEPVKFRKSTKQFFLHSMNMVITSSGNGRLGRRAQFNAENAAINLDSFDEMVETSGQWFRLALEETRESEPELASIGGSVFLVGPSEKAGQFITWGLSGTHIDGFRMPDLFVQPSPVSRQVSEWELARIETGFAAAFPDMLEELANMRAEWTAARPMRVHQLEDWITIAKRCRKERSRSGSGLRVYVAGDLMHTELREGSANSRVIHSFDDEGPEVLEMAAESLHPLGQWRPCYFCDSGEPYVECCARVTDTMPCGCGSRKNFVDCCLVARDADLPLRLWTEPFEWPFSQKGSS